MSGSRIGALIKKDMTLLFRNKVLSILPIATLVVIIAIYFALPREVNETMKLAVYGAALPITLVNELADEGMHLAYMDSEESLMNEVGDGRFAMGIIFPADLLEGVSGGRKPEVRAVFPPTAMPEMKSAQVAIVKQIVFQLQGEPLDIVDEAGEVLGPDMAGRQIPARDRLLPIFAVFVILMEIMGLATLIAEEYDRGTMSSLVVSSLPMESFLTAKAVTGVGVTFIQAVLLLAVTGTLFDGPLLLLTGLLLGSLLVAGIGFLVAAVSRDMMTVIAWSMLVMILLFMPAMNIVLPGLTSNWVKIIPSYYLTDLMHQVAHFGAGWTDMWRNVVFLFAFDLGLISLGLFALRRKTV